jgi:hypothetical protein
MESTAVRAQLVERPKNQAGAGHEMADTRTYFWRLAQQLLAAKRQNKMHVVFGELQRDMIAGVSGQRERCHKQNLSPGDRHLRKQGQVEAATGAASATNGALFGVRVDYDGTLASRLCLVHLENSFDAIHFAPRSDQICCRIIAHGAHKANMGFCANGAQCAKRLGHSASGVESGTSDYPFRSRVT